MKILSIGSDPLVLDPQSRVIERQKAYTLNLEELNIVVTGRKNDNHDPFIINISPKLNVFDARSKNRFYSLFLAYKIASKVVTDKAWKDGEFYISSQDPFFSGLIAYLLARKFSVPFELQIHTDLTSKNFIYYSFGNFLRFFIARFLLPKASHIRVVLNKTKNDLVKYWHIDNNRIELRPIPIIDEPKQNISFNLKEKYGKFSHHIVMVGRLEKEKNLFFALRVFKEVLRSHPRAGLFIVGDGSLSSKLKVYAKKLSIGDNVIFLGFVTNIWDIYRTADLLLHTSYYEGYGMVFIEANKCNLPIISSNVGVIGELRGRVKVMDGFNEKEFVRAIAGVLGN